MYRQLTIQHIEEVRESFRTFSFAEGHGIQYRAGQYLTLVRFDGDEEVRRSYSMVSAPLLQEPLTIGVQRVPNGKFSRFLVDQARVGDTVLTSGAGGLFTLPDNADGYPLVFFFAAGSGITPIYSLLRTVLAFHPHMRVVLVYSNASAGKTIFHRELNELVQRYPATFFPEFIFSNNPLLYRAHLNRDLLLELLHRYAGNRLQQVLFYTCGPESYMRFCMYVLQEQGVPSDNIRRELFYLPPKLLQAAVPPDTAAQDVTITAAGITYRLTVQYPSTLLDAALEKDIPVAYSCRTGRCGNCVARCLKGKVWMSNNEVLTDRDLQQGLVLTCVGYPVEGPVVLEL